MFSINKTFFHFERSIWEEKEEILMKRMINKLGYSYSSSESLSLSKQSYFCMDKTKLTEKAYDWVKLQTPGFLNIARLRPFASGYPWNKRSFSILNIFKRDLTLTLIGCIIDNVKSIITFGVCWNWYTERPQKPLDKYPCGFDSRHADQYGSLVQMVQGMSFSRS